MRVRYLLEATADLESILDYIALDSPAAADRVGRRIEGAIKMLGRHPAMGRPGRVLGTRELVIPDTPYIVPYRVRGGTLEILRIFHGSRRWPKKF